MGCQAKREKETGVLRSQRGVSLVQALIAATLVCAGGFGVVRFATMTTDSMKKATDVPKVVKIGNIGLSNARQVLLNVIEREGPNKDKKMAGVCRLLSTPMQSGGVGQIEISLFAAGDDKFKKDWERAFPSEQWEMFSAPYCRPDGYKRCLRPNSNVEGLKPEEIHLLQPEIFIELVPIFVRGSSGDGRSAVRLPRRSGETTREEASNIAFLVLSTTRYTAKKGPDSATTRRLDRTTRMAVWVGEAECEYEYTLGGTTNTLLLNPSAIGSGVKSKTVFSADSGELSNRLLRVTFPTSVRMESQVAEDDGKRVGVGIRMESSMASISCNENRYRCPNRSITSREWALAMGGAVFRVIFNRANPHHLTSSVDIEPRYTIKKGGGEISPAPNATYSTVNGPLVDGKATIISNWRTVSMEISNTPQVCSEICKESGSSPYNWSPDIVEGDDYNEVVQKSKDNSDPLYFGHVENTMPDVQVGGSTHVESDTDPKPVGCSCCYKKQCAMVGVSVFGYCHLQPPEPLDSRVPECEGTNDSIVQEKQLSNDPIAGTGDCVSAKLSSDSLDFTRRACSGSLRSLCYFQGTYRLAQDGLTKSYTRSDFNGAFQACYNMGGERLNRVEADAFLTAQGNLIAADMPPVVGDNYEFVNSAAAGYFIAPQDAPNLKMVAQGVRTIFFTPVPDTGFGRQGGILAALSPDEQFWVNLRVDSTGFMYAAPPEIPTTTSEFSTESDQDGVFHFNRDPDHTLTTSSASAMLLLNTRRYFGALNVSPTQGSSQRVVCFDPHTNEVKVPGSGTAQLSDARGICQGADAIFIPPVTPSQWTAAMVKSAEMSPRRPWPAPPTPPTGNLVGAWVAYERMGSEWQSNALIKVGQPDKNSKDFGREVYFVGSYGAPITLPEATSSEPPAEPGGVQVLCRTGDRENPFELKDGGSCSGEYFLNSSNESKLKADGAASLMESRNAIIAIAKKIDPSNMLGGTRIALNKYEKIPNCSSSDPKLGDGDYKEKKKIIKKIKKKCMKLGVEVDLELDLEEEYECKKENATDTKPKWIFVRTVSEEDCP